MKRKADKPTKTEDHGRTCNISTEETIMPRSTNFTDYGEWECKYGQSVRLFFLLTDLWSWGKLRGKQLGRSDWTAHSVCFWLPKQVFILKDSLQMTEKKTFCNSDCKHMLDHQNLALSKDTVLLSHIVLFQLLTDGNCTFQPHSVIHLRVVLLSSWELYTLLRLFACSQV